MFGLAACVGTKTCDNGKCGIQCQVDDDDCFNMSNDLMLVDCIGTLSCQNRFCTKKCSELKGRLDDITAASSSSVEGQDLVLPEKATSTTQLDDVAAASSSSVEGQDLVLPGA